MQIFHTKSQPKYFDFVRDFIFCGDFTLRSTMPRINGLLNIGGSQAGRRRQSWPHDDRTVTLSQIVHLTLRCRVVPYVNFDRQR